MGVFKRVKKRNLYSSVVAIALLLLVCFLFRNSISPLWETIVPKILIFCIAALSLNIICGCLGEFVLGHGGFLLIGYTVSVIVGLAIHDMIGADVYGDIAYNVSEGLKPVGYLLIIGDILVAAVVTGGIGLVVGLIALGRLKGDYLAIVTLGISLIFVNIVEQVPFLGGTTGKGVVTKLGGNPFIYAIVLIASLFLILTFMKSRFGRSILACRDDNIAAEACGVDVKKYKVLAFTFAAFLAGLAGGLYSHYITLQPSKFGIDLSIELLIIVVLGGLGSLTGSILSTIIIVSYTLWFSQMSWVPDFFKSNPKIIYGIILIAIMLFRPKGILGVNEFSWDWFYSKLKSIWNKIVNIFKKKTSKEVK